MPPTEFGQRLVQPVTLCGFACSAYLLGQGCCLVIEFVILGFARGLKGSNYLLVGQVIDLCCLDKECLPFGVLNFLRKPLEGLNTLIAGRQQIDTSNGNSTQATQPSPYGHA